MFATLVVESPPLQWQDFPSSYQTWLWAAGGFAAVALLVRLLFLAAHRYGGSSVAPGPPAAAQGTGGAGQDGSSRWRWLLGSLVGGLVLGGIALALPRIWTALGWAAPMPARAPAAKGGSAMATVIADLLAGWVFAAIALPVLANLRDLRGRRIWALARLSMKEALWSRALWVFSILLLLFLFGSWFLPYKPENQVRNYVQAVFLVMTVLLLLTAAMLSAFSIPSDVRHQTIHTIVTKPVERFEIVIGRFVGYALLMTLVLAVMTGVSLIYVAREVNLDPDAREESLKARVPIFGDDLQIANPKWVGREWEYRKYIAGGVSEDRATWVFAQLPPRLADRDRVRCEFSYRIFHTTKGDERTGVSADFRFETPAWHEERAGDYTRERQEAIAAGKPDDEVDAELAQKYGVYEARSVRVEDFHTQFVEVPGALFRDTEAAPGKPALRVIVRLVDPNQYLGVAKHDFYILDTQKGFAQNFIKGAVGLWFRLCIVIGLAVTASTYLSGVISFLLAGFLYLAGVCLPFIKDLAEHKTYFGGPMESLLRLSRDMTTTRPLEEGATTALAIMIDNAFSMFLRPFLYLVPDVSRFDLTDYVADGFNVSAGLLFVHNLLPAVGYLLPWAILAFYLIRSREIAA